MVAMKPLAPAHRELVDASVCAFGCGRWHGEDGRKPIAIPHFSLGVLLCYLGSYELVQTQPLCQQQGFDGMQMVQRNSGKTLVSTPAPREPVRLVSPPASRKTGREKEG